MRYIESSTAKISLLIFTISGSIILFLQTLFEPIFGDIHPTFIVIYSIIAALITLIDVGILKGLSIIRQVYLKVILYIISCLVAICSLGYTAATRIDTEFSLTDSLTIIALASIITSFGIKTIRTSYNSLEVIEVLSMLDFERVEAVSLGAKKGLKEESSYPRGSVISYREVFGFTLDQRPPIYITLDKKFFNTNWEIRKRIKNKY